MPLYPFTAAITATFRHPPHREPRPSRACREQGLVHVAVPTTDGETAITGYRVACSSDGVTWLTVDVVGTTATITDYAGSILAQHRDRR